MTDLENASSQAFNGVAVHEKVAILYLPRVGNYLDQTRLVTLAPDQEAPRAEQLPPEAVSYIIQERRRVIEVSLPALQGFTFDQKDGPTVFIDALLIETLDDLKACALTSRNKDWEDALQKGRKLIQRRDRTVIYIPSDNILPLNYDTKTGVVLTLAKTVSAATKATPAPAPL